MWSSVAKKKTPPWLWHAIDHHRGKVLASVERHVDAEKHTVGKEHMQLIESKHITLQTRIKRLVRRTICFSKTEHMHDLVVGLSINRYECGVSL